MRYRHRDGAEGHTLSLTAVRDKARPGPDGVFEVDEDRPDFVEIHAMLVDEGHEPLEDDSADADNADDDGEPAEDGADQDTEDVDVDVDADDEADVDQPRASDYSEDELVAMDWGPMQSLAAQYDDIPGSGISADRMTELLIEQRREEVDDGS